MRLIGGARTIFTLLFRRGECRDNLSPLSTAITFRVMPWDLHFRVAHMDSYGFFMELGRWDQARMLGVIPILLKEAAAPFTLFQIVRFCKPLKLFQKFTVTTELVFVDENFTYIKHTIYRDETLICYGLIKYLISGKNGKITPQRFYRDHYSAFVGKQAPTYAEGATVAVDQLFNSISQKIKE